MAKIADLSKGDRVRWGTSQGKTTGTVVGIKTKPFSIKGTDLEASKDDPKVVVESEKTGAQAGHKPSALSKLKARATGTAKDSKAKDAKAEDSKAKETKTKETKKAKDSKAKDSKAKDTSKSTKAKDSSKSTTKAKSTGKAKGTKAGGTATKATKKAG